MKINFWKKASKVPNLDALFHLYLQIRIVFCRLWAFCFPIITLIFLIFPTNGNSDSVQTMDNKNVPYSTSKFQGCIHIWVLAVGGDKPNANRININNQILSSEKKARGVDKHFFSLGCNWRLFEDIRALTFGWGPSRLPKWADYLFTRIAETAWDRGHMMNGVMITIKS